LAVVSSEMQMVNWNLVVWVNLGFGNFSKEKLYLFIGRWS